MKRRLVAAGLVLLFPLGMAACKEINNARDKALEQVDALSVFSGSDGRSRTSWTRSSPSTRKPPRRSPTMT